MPENGPGKRHETMASNDTNARKIRRLNASLTLWKERGAEKQQEIRKLRVKVRDLTASRDQWKSRAQELEQRLSAVEAAQPDSLELCSPFSFFGG
jgi:predicted  nucleic acid-binding Zn-ribbon protein